MVLKRQIKIINNFVLLFFVFFFCEATNRGEACLLAVCETPAHDADRFCFTPPMRTRWPSAWVAACADVRALVPIDQNPNRSID